MTVTVMETISRSDGWVSVATDPANIAIKSNSPGKWHLAIAAAEPTANFEGEVWENRFEPWIGAGITGQVWIRVNGDNMSFAITI